MTDAAGRTVVTGQGTRVVLGKLIKSGGAGSVYRLRDLPTQVAKVYHPNQDHAHYEKKIAAMLELTPELPDLALDGRRIVQIAWPQTPIRDERGRYLGYLMPAVDVDATSELECILQERQARREGLPTGLGAKVTLAANLSAVIAELHRQRHYVVDLKPVNLRFYRQSLYMAMLDCDGFSIQGKGERFEAPQYTPDYLAPEFHSKQLTGAGEAQQDRFALAVVVFQLLNFGIHPFTGRPTSDQVPTDIPSRIAGRWYAHGLRPNRALQPVPSSGHATMPAEIRQLFDRAFESAGSTRPSADEWATVLKGYAQRSAGKLKVCARNEAHQHFAGNDCAQCGREKLIASVQAAAASAPRTTRVGTPLPPPLPGTRRGTATTRRPGTTGTQPRVPPVLGNIQKRWTTPANPAPPAPPPQRAPRRPANWPAPAPPSSYTPSQPSSSGPGFKAQAIAYGVVIGFFILLQVIAGFSERSTRADNAQETAQRAEQQRRAVERAQEQRQAELDRRAQDDSVLAQFQPGMNDLSSMSVTALRLATYMGEGRGGGLEAQLVELRRKADMRRQQWEWTMESKPATFDRPGPVGVELDPDPARLKDNPLDTHVALAIGWSALTRGQDSAGKAAILQALWADPDNADAWFAYGLVSNSKASPGALAIALLLYPESRSFETRVAAAAPILRANGIEEASLAAQVEAAWVLARKEAARAPQETTLPGVHGLRESAPP